MYIQTLKHLSLGITATVLLASVITLATPSLASALSGSDFQAGRIIDDPVFFDSNRMAAQDIQNFLNSKVPVCDTNGTKPHNGTTRAAYAATKGVSPPFVCLKDYRQDVPTTNGDQYCSGIGAATNRTAAEIIKIVSDACFISPMVLITTLQKEQSLVTDEWPWPVQYQKATGYGCPDTAECASEYGGFFKQVYHAARQFHIYAQRPELFSYRPNRTSYVQYNPNSGCSGTQVSMVGQATAGLYNYTPYQPNQAALANLYGTGDGCSAYGNRNFWRLYNDWFGSPVTSACGFERNQPVIGDVKLRKKYSNIDSGALVLYNGTATNCIESHTWGGGFTSWIENTASNQKMLIPNDCTFKYADLNADGRDEPLLICFQNTGSGKVEFHVWNYDMKGWIVHAISNLPAIDPAKTAFEFADMNGDGRDEPIAINYRNSGSGNVEFHYWNDGLQSWRSHVITNLPGIDPNDMNIVFGDLDGNGVDEAMAVGVASTSTGKIEFHVWAPGQWAWDRHVVSNQSLVNMSNFSIIFGNFRGHGPDQGVLIGKQSTSSGRIEFHTWEPGMTAWAAHHASHQPTL